MPALLTQLSRMHQITHRLSVLIIFALVAAGCGDSNGGGSGTESETAMKDYNSASVILATELAKIQENYFDLDTALEQDDLDTAFALIDSQETMVASFDAGLTTLTSAESALGTSTSALTSSLNFSSNEYAEVITAGYATYLLVLAGVTYFGYTMKKRGGKLAETKKKHLAATDETEKKALEADMKSQAKEAGTEAALEIGSTFVPVGKINTLGKVLLKNGAKEAGKQTVNYVVSKGCKDANNSKRDETSTCRVVIANPDDFGNFAAMPGTDYSIVSTNEGYKRQGRDGLEIVEGEESLVELDEWEVIQTVVPTNASLWVICSKTGELACTGLDIDSAAFDALSYTEQGDKCKAAGFSSYYKAGVGSWTEQAGCLSVCSTMASLNDEIVCAEM